MATKAELQKQVAELKAMQARAEVLYQISRGLSAARDEHELLQVLAQPAREAGAFRATLLYIDLDGAGQPEWLELVASLEQEDTPAVPVGTRYYVPKFPLAHLWLDSTYGPLFIADIATETRADENARDTYAQMGIQATVIIPLTQARRWVGLLCFYWREPHEFGEQELAIYHALVDLATPAVESHRLAKEARVRAEELAVLNELGQALTTRLDVDQVLEEAYRQATRLVDTTNFYIAFYDPERDEVAFPFVRDVTEEKIETRRAGEGLTEHIIRSESPLLIQEDLPKRMGELGIDSIGQLALSWLGVPLIVGDRAIGVMGVQSYTIPRLYDEHDRDLLTAIASPVAIALQNARLFEETQRRVREVQLLHDVGLAAASGVRLEETLQAAAEALGAEFEDTLVALMLLDPESDTLRVEANVGYSFDMVKNLGLPLGEGITGWVAQHGEPALVPDVRLDPRYYSATSDTRSELCVPLVAGSQVIGVINVESPQVSAFTDDDQRLLSTLASNLAVLVERARLFDNMEQMVAQRTRELRESLEKSARLQRQVIKAQKRAIQELSTPIIPIVDAPGRAGGIIVMPLIGSIDTLRARDITRSLLAGIREHRAKVVILDITGVPIVDSGVASHLNKTIQAARLKGAHAIVTGISDAVAETIVDLGIDWSGIETLADLQTGLIVALGSLGIKLTR